MKVTYLPCVVFEKYPGNRVDLLFALLVLVILTVVVEKSSSMSKDNKNITGGSNKCQG